MDRGQEKRKNSHVIHPRRLKEWVCLSEIRNIPIGSIEMDFCFKFHTPNDPHEKAYGNAFISMDQSFGQLQTTNQLQTTKKNEEMKIIQNFVIFIFN